MPLPEILQREIQVPEPSQRTGNVGNAADGGASARFSALCEQLRPDLLRFAFWLGRDRQLAEDVVQEAMLRAWKSFGSLADERQAKSWLLTIVRRELARTFERKRLEVVNLDALVAAEAPVLATGEDEHIATMREALFRLDTAYREPLILQVHMGFSTREIASWLNLSQGSVLTRLFRARMRLREVMSLVPGQKQAG